MLSFPEILCVRASVEGQLILPAENENGLLVLLRVGGWTESLTLAQFLPCPHNLGLPMALSATWEGGCYF